MSEKKQLVTLVDIADTTRYARTGEIEIPANASNGATQFIKGEDGVLVRMYRTNKSNLDFPTTPKPLRNPKYFANFNFGYCDCSGIVHGLRSIAEDATKTVTFVCADHPDKGGDIHNILIIGIDIYKEVGEEAKATWRICNANGSASQAGSEGLIHGSDESLESACTAVAMIMKRPNTYIFRQPSKKK